MCTAPCWSFSLKGRCGDEQGCGGAKPQSLILLTRTRGGQDLNRCRLYCSAFVLLSPAAVCPSPHPQDPPSGAPRGREPRLRSGHLLEHVDEIAGNVGLARLVRFEVAQDTVLALPPEGCSKQLRKGCQAVRVVGEPELTATEPRTHCEDWGSWHPPPAPPRQVSTSSQENRSGQSPAPAPCNPGSPCGPCCSRSALTS